MRELATVQKINGIKSIPEADSICAYGVQGWWVVDLIGKYNVGDLVCYLEIDSWVPTEIAPFLSKGKEPRVFEGVKGERLRTVRLKKTCSQGLLLSIDLVDSITVSEGDDVSDFLGIKKWEAPLPACLSGLAKGTFPSFLHKSDQERCCDASTVIETKDGFKTIKEICDTKYSGKIKSYNTETNSIEFSKVTNWAIVEPTTDLWLKIKTKSGKELFVTKNHRIFNPTEGTFKDASTFSVGMFLFS